MCSSTKQSMRKESYFAQIKCRSILIHVNKPRHLRAINNNNNDIIIIIIIIVVVVVVVVVIKALTLY